MNKENNQKLGYIGFHKSFKCTYIDLICRDTIDEKVISILKDKIKLSAKILGEKAREWL
jgi:hypothetical protein